MRDRENWIGLNLNYSGGLSGLNPIPQTSTEAKGSCCAGDGHWARDRGMYTPLSPGVAYTSQSCSSRDRNTINDRDLLVIPGKRFDCIAYWHFIDIYKFKFKSSDISSKPIDGFDDSLSTNRKLVCVDCETHPIKNPIGSVGRKGWSAVVRTTHDFYVETISNSEVTNKWCIGCTNFNQPRIVGKVVVTRLAKTAGNPRVGNIYLRGKNCARRNGPDRRQCRRRSVREVIGVVSNFFVSELCHNTVIRRRGRDWYSYILGEY